MKARILLVAPALALLLPGATAAQQLGTVVVPAEAQVVIAARGAPQPRLAPRPAPVAPPGGMPGGRAPSWLFEPAYDELTSGMTTGQALLPFAAAAALAATLGNGAPGRGGGTTAPARTR
ncbi:hypothetical protein [Caldovatus aquaticus]|uniref:Uncharacterized protein n=1 Tax=Caldovatus aquaticus TaxID=2865671 RepID=A0ABS7F0G7_9PROT|nr:hypothetical protein [Caldovatus aquaticus]MBW8269094.1 hypothetical protein [Caldovatus aquaticus]